uniref:Uncharacterized protein n=1 Tax=Triticum urartu TaxID=4572 RepID=A0A8R7JXV9_TRIUA
MKMQLQDRRVIGTQWETKYPPHSLRRGDPSCVNVSLDLINVTISVWLVNAERSLIMALINVLINVFYSLYARADLDVYVAIKHPQKVRVIWHNPSVVQHFPSNLSASTIVSTTINWV